MSKTPRNVRLALALLLACAPCARGAFAQKRTAAPPPSKAAREAERSRRKAVAVLLEVAAGAKALEDASQRASVLTLAASALWGADEQAARSTFARAWEAAVESDEAEFKKEQEGGRDGDLPERFTGMREAVLAAAAQHDPRMADAWLGALAEWLARRRGEEAAAEEGGGGADIGPADEFTRDGQRLSLASTLADEGSYAEAARVAAPTIQGGVSGALVEFLLRLRMGAPEEADRLYLQLLASARARPDSTANDVLILSSYVLTPRLLAAVNADGSVGFRPIADAPAAQTSARTREVFFDSAAAILLRASPDSQAAGDTSALYFAIGRLLPYFEREGPRHAAALQAKLSSLAAQLGLERRAGLDSKMGTRDLSPQNPADPLRRLLEQADGAGDPKLRDEARLKVVVEAARKSLWERARRAAEEIADPETQHAARAAIDAFQVATARTAFNGDEGDLEKMEALARGADVPPALRAYGFVLAADLAARRGAHESAAALLEEAFAQAAQTERGTFARDAAALLTASAAARLDSPRAWDALAAAVAALNEDEKFDGAPIQFGLETRTEFGPGVADALDYALGQFDLEELFDAAAQKNFDRATAEARNLKSPAARAQALIWAARAELVKAERAPAYARPVR
ncbi:MAG: hypothetical protein JOZ02_17270 [Acidobacteria bacterium]|nr:hypothetical protein [Acidobacteriota bacterium]